MAEQAKAWEELQRAGATPDAPVTQPGLGARAMTWWRQAVPWQKGAVVFLALLGLATMAALATGMVLAAGRMLGGRESQPAAIALPPATPTATLPSPTPTATLVPTPTPTSLPRLVVWSPSGACAYARPKAAMDDKPLACVPNGTEVLDLGKRGDENGYTWAQVQYPTKAGRVTAWMAFEVVVWPFHPDKATGPKWTTLYDGNKVSARKSLPPRTPLVVLQDEGDGWSWVQLPDGIKGYVREKDLEK